MNYAAIVEAAAGDEALLQLIEKRREHQQALYNTALGSNDPGKINRALSFADSGSRLPMILDLTKDAPAQVFWAVFLKAWTSCDATWDHRRTLLRRLRRHRDAIAFLKPTDRAFYDAMPNRVRVFRGCAAARVKAISWTTSESVAISFARGHRTIPVPKPVVAVADIPKRCVFAVATAREENEVILDPAALKIRSVAPLKAHPACAPVSAGRTAAKRRSQLDQAKAGRTRA